MKPDARSSEITPESSYINRRNFMRAGILGASALATGVLYRTLNRSSSGGKDASQLATISTSPTSAPIGSGFRTDEPLSTFEQITNYNNFYEFSTDKEAVAGESANFIARPWTVVVDGNVSKPRTFDIDEIEKLAPAEERVYRMRCVEGWSMVIPWIGLPLGKLLNAVEPMSSAKYVAFQTLNDPTRMPNQKRAVLDWPYLEGLRMDEAMHPLTILATGLYGKQLPPQNGAPLRLVVPWKYGFKGIKSIVKITLLESEPPTTWNRYATKEYGFYANVNPTVSHPRWSQATEQRIGQLQRRDTLMFNGYGEQVASLYAGMDLTKHF